ncbi:Heat shock transcription factor [Coemansia sp. RSA 1722]|nr:Heat shock transcription factor [Coemansia sp. RSA 485]KAJ2601348.1 Heat shock transcription factor [Coemansia sp. RSA 1722]KAJ2603151.1 Heat shock transcription factor [Coemansia sp. RSA 1721]
MNTEHERTSSTSSLSSCSGGSNSSSGSGYIGSGENTGSLVELAEACQFVASSQKAQPELTRAGNTSSERVTIPAARLQMLEAYEQLVKTHSCFRGAVFSDQDALAHKRKIRDDNDDDNDNDNNGDKNSSLGHNATASAANEEVIGFVYALYRIVENQTNTEWIRWADNGSSFEFCDWERLMACLRRYGLKARQRASVTKNLTDYSFRRLKDMRKRVPGHGGIIWWHFSHSDFIRGSPDRLCRIVRSYGKKENSKRNESGSNSRARVAASDAYSDGHIGSKRQRRGMESSRDKSTTDTSIHGRANKRSRKGKEREY